MLQRFSAALIVFLLVLRAAPANSQDAATHKLTLGECLAYSLQHQPAARQALLDEQIARTNKAIAFAGWLPQLNGAVTYQHYLQLPTAFQRLNGNLTPINTGLYNVSVPQLGASQNIFSTDVLLANKASEMYQRVARENTVAVKNNTVTQVSKAYYDVLLAMQRIYIFSDDTARQRKNQSDAYHRYVSGLTDKVDYKQATIGLNNTLAQLKTATEDLGTKLAVLKQQMGFMPEATLSVQYDTTLMMQDIAADTLAGLVYQNRPEYRQLQLMRQIQAETTKYYRFNFLPSLAATYNYYYVFQNNNLGDLYTQAYPNSLVGLQLNLPLFTGFRRLENIKKSKLQEERADWDVLNLKLIINSQYTSALAGYKSNLNYFHLQAENRQMAREVYNIVKMQYSEGIKPYVDVIIAESDLQESEINYMNALFQVLQSKVDLDKARGEVNINY